MRPLDRFIDLIAAGSKARTGFASHYAAGLDAAINGANHENCHFGWFNSKENTAEWSRGNRDGAALKVRNNRYRYAGATLAGFRPSPTV